MGEPVKILDLARNMIRLAGHTLRDATHPEGDIEIEITGLRPGEKLYEELLIATGNAEGTAHPKIMKANEPCVEAVHMESLIQQLRAAIEAQDQDSVRKMLMGVAR